MRSLLALLASLVTLLCISDLAARYPPRPEILILPEEINAGTEALNTEFLLLNPELKSSIRELPLLIFLHGAGGGGGDIRRIAGQPAAVLRSIIRFDRAPCLVVAPQCRRESATGERGTWIPADLDLFLNYLCRTLPIDRSRVYLTGNSMGGYGTWAWAAASPQRFAAIAPVVGGIGPGGPKDITPELDQWIDKLLEVPIWAFAGALDKVVPAEHPERIVRAVQAKDHPNARITIYPDMGHDAGRRAYDDPEFYRWLFAQKRD